MGQILLSIFKTGKNAQNIKIHGVYGKGRANTVYTTVQKPPRPLQQGFTI
jgi:hypothetical protein